ncbi:MATE family efflux transporter [Bradyrhizobium sp. 141]|uniref:MATE family efflux transporter n=1 Tax=Bradyrhizobium sp. 141 TaxID=2782617 RepID=UPI001FFA156D|nr:MATE family efflux transporter [Bradyrhizobium sp. 141]MCK1718215.1 MATE family efflux transporter [Bradyrhizobium sp. 141]
MDKIAKTKPALISRPEGTRRAAIRRFSIELGETAKLALPMVLTQVGQIAMMTTDLAFIGRISAEALAAAALAGRIYFISVTFGVGLLSAIAPLAARAFGENNLGAVRRTLRMGLWAALILSFPIIVVALRAEKILLAMGQAPDVAQLAQQYLFGLAFGGAPALAFFAIRSFMGGVNRPQPVFWITLSAIPLNALLVYMLAYGKLGLPRLELFGAGLATTLVNCSIFLAGLWFAALRRPFRDYHVFAHLWRFDWRAMRQLIAIGTPISIASLIESGLFLATSLLAGLISTSALVAHQIVVQIAAIMFMIYLGVGTAAAVRVGHAAGRDDRAGVKRANLAAMLLGIVIAATLTLTLIAARFEIVELFLGRSAGDSEATIGVAAKLIVVGATLFITDAAQCIAAGGLRGLRDTRVPLLLAAFAWWLIGFSLSYWLGLKMGLGAIGIWIGLSIGTTIYAALLVLRFRHLTSRAH